MVRYVPPPGELIRKARHAKKFRVLHCASFVGVKEQVWFDWENGQRPPPKYHIMMRICTYLGIDLQTMFISCADYYLKKSREKPSKKVETNE